jgi:hypothetical protein
MDETYRARIHLIGSGTTLPEVVLDAIGGTSPFWDPDGGFVIVSSPDTRSFMVSLTDGAILKTFFFDSTWVDRGKNALGTVYLVVGTVLYTKLFSNWQEVGLFGLSNVRTVFSNGSRTNRP